MANVKSKITNAVATVKTPIKFEELSEGMLVWFVPDEFGARVGLIVKLTTRGTQKVDIVWQKSGENYTVKRTTPSTIQSIVSFPSPDKHEMAVARYRERVMKDGANPTGAVIEAMKRFA